MNTPSQSLHLRTLLIATAAAATLTLAACGRNDDRTVGQQVDSAIAKTEQNAAEAKQDAKQGMAEAKSDVQTAANNAKQSMENGADKAGAAIDNAANKLSDKVADASITASVNAELAKDPSLSALRINVDTTDGRVMLRGTAPDGNARERATRLAAAVKGVNSVDNQLEVRG